MENAIPHDDTARPVDENPASPPSRAWRRAALGVPLLVVVAVVLFALFTPIPGHRLDRESDECRWLPLSWDYWATSVGGLAAAVGAVALHIGLRLYARSRGWQPRTREGLLADGTVVLGWVMVLLTAAAVWVTVTDYSEYTATYRNPMCEGLAAPGR